MENDFILSMKDICKSFPGVKALDCVTIQLRRGSVHALLGENGAGKSTLMKILSGVYCADSGTISIQGEKVRIDNTKDSLALGIGMIHQELSFAPNMTIAENIYLGRELTTHTGMIDRRRMAANVQRMLDENGVLLKSTTVMGKLSIAQAQMVEIIKVLSMDARIIVMDEPTSALTQQETRALFTRIREIQGKGISIFYISHKLEEIFEVCDTVTVLRDGKTVETLAIKDVDRSMLIRLMVGRSISNVFPPMEKHEGDVIFELRNFTSAGRFHDINLSLRKGEIVGLSGLMGSGRSEMARAVVGLDKFDSGEALLNGRKLAISNPKDAIEQRIVLVPEDRRLMGFVPERSIIDNISLPHLHSFTRLGFINQKRELRAGKRLYDMLRIKARNERSHVSSLSGGNQQKVVVAKWLMGDPEVIIMDEPTRGIDVGAKYEIYVLMNDLAAKGKAVLMISSELPEILGMSHRVLVMHEGTIAGELSSEEATQEKIMRLATGGK